MISDPFSSLPSKARRTIRLEKEEVLFRQGDTTSGLYRVLTGRVTLLRTGATGDTLTLHKAVAGGYFAEASIFSKAYHCDAVCTETGSVVKIAKVDVLHMMQSNPDFSAIFMKLLAGQVQHYRAHIEMLGIASAKERVLVAFQAGYFDATVKELASRINLTHEACYRALRALCDDGRLTQTARGKYVLS